MNIMKKYAQGDDYEEVCPRGRFWVMILNDFERKMINLDFKLFSVKSVIQNGWLSVF